MAGGGGGRSSRPGGPRTSGAKREECAHRTEGQEWRVRYLQAEEALEARPHVELDAVERAVEEQGAHEENGEQHVRRGGGNIDNLCAHVTGRLG